MHGWRQHSVESCHFISCGFVLYLRLNDCARPSNGSTPKEKTTPGAAELGGPGGPAPPPPIFAKTSNKMIWIRLRKYEFDDPYT